MRVAPRQEEELDSSRPVLWIGSVFLVAANLFARPKASEQARYGHKRFVVWWTPIVREAGHHGSCAFHRLCTGLRRPVGDAEAPQLALCAENKRSAPNALFA